jgi:hypothetical protein
VYSSPYSPQQWPTFAQAALAGDVHAMRDTLPSKGQKRAGLRVASNSDQIGEPIGPGVTGEPDETSNDFQLEALHPELLAADYEDADPQDWSYQDTPNPTREQGGNSMAVVLAGAAVVAYLVLT